MLSWKSLIWALAILLVIPATVAHGQQAKVDVLRIGSSGSLAGKASKADEQAALDTLKSFIQDETGLSNEIIRQKSWRELADQLKKGQLHLGVFQGYEFAWAQATYPGLKPLVVAVNGHVYPVAYVVTSKESDIKDFAGLQGKSLAMPPSNLGFLQLFVERQCDAQGKKMKDFFSKITSPDNVEDAVDDVVDGAVQATVVDRAAMEAYKRRKPGRFKRLKEIIHSEPFPPGVVAYYEDVLDRETLQRCRTGLLNASDKENGQMLLTLFRLTGFQEVPKDFTQVLAKTRKAYPAPSQEQTEARAANPARR